MGVASAGKKNVEKLLSSYKTSYHDDYSKLTAAMKGLKAEAVFDLIAIAGLSTEAVEQALNKSMKTFQNYRTNKTVLDAATSEKLIRLFELYDKGIEVFGNVNEFSEWLSKPAYGLNEIVPQSILSTITGVNLIYEELVRIEYGDLA